MIYVDPSFLRDSLCPRTDRLCDGRFPLASHRRLASPLTESQAKVMISYDNRPEVRALHPSECWRTVRLQWRYCGRYAVTGESKAECIKEGEAVGDELLIRNY